MNNHLNWWRYVPGANWRHPLGPRSSLSGRAKDPVVHIAYEDAEAYAAWAGKDLPTEVEWEFAARGGLDGADYAWGDELTSSGVIMANTWQGEFPYVDKAEDGFSGTSPVGSFPPNGYGLFDMIGNVWEWTTDWYQARHKANPSCCEGAHKARGGTADESYDPHMPNVKILRKVTKGGSYLCAPNYCQRYRPAARMAQPIDTATCHLGFRCIVRNSELPPCEMLEFGLKTFSSYTALIVEGIAVLLIGYGAAEAFFHVCLSVVMGAAPSGWRKELFVRLGIWLLLGLQFALAADIVRTVIAPTWNDIGQLAAIALIRTFLNHFLEKDLEEAGLSAVQAGGKIDG
jgi:uncharacterized membrane protein